MLTLLLSLCCGFINTGRGRGKDSWFHWAMKEFTYLSMALSAYIITDNIYIAILFPLPECIFWWYGTGEAQPYVTKYMRWDIFESVSVFTYCILSGIIYQLTN